MAKNNISLEILQHILDSGSDNVTIETDSFWQALMSGGQKPFKKRTVRLISFVLVAVFTIAFMLYGTVFLIQNVLLHKADLQINQFGTFIRKSYNSEYAMFLYDPAEEWAASGIQVQDGDRLFISASGAYHTNYAQLIDATQNNHWADIRNQLIANGGREALNNTMIIDSLKKQKRLYRYIDMSIPPDSITPYNPYYIDTLNLKVKRPGHLNDTALFGDVLMQIIPENLMRDTAQIGKDSIYAIPRMQKNIKESLIIEHNGVLTFGVNDNRPQNNIGQILVVMEIYRRQTWQNALKKLYKGQLIDFPYYWYDYWRHTSTKLDAWWHPFAAIAFVMWIIAEFLIICIFLYCLPFLFLKETWQKEYMLLAKIKSLCHRHCKQ